jgi:excisionase family DNA binding protein
MYQKSENDSTYVGTSYAAKMLNLSVGTVQKLVNDGSLAAYMTSGGHRRISYNSVIQYCQKNKIPLNVSGVQGLHSPDVINICVLFGEKGITPNLADIVKDGTFQVVSDPMKLIRKSGEATHIFIDARIEWINWQQMEQSTTDVHYVIYNSLGLSHPVRKHLETLATLMEADISIELLRGYRLGLHTNSTDRSGLAHFPHMVKQ